MRKVLIPLLAAAIVLSSCTYLREGAVDSALNGVFPLFRDGRWGGSCWVLEQHGDVALLVTCAHVTQGYPALRVGNYTAYLVYQDRALDVSLLTVHTEDRLPTRQLAEARLGEECWATGYLGDEGGRPSLAVCYGRVSSVSVPSAYGRVLLGNNGLIGGMSGGPLLNKYGEVIGMSHRVMAWGSAMDSFCLFVPSSVVREARDRLFQDDELSNP